MVTAGYYATAAVAAVRLIRTYVLAGESILRQNPHRVFGHIEK